MNRRWRLRYVKNLPDCWGKCDPPDKVGRTITVSKEASGLKELDTLIHEMQHACNWLQASEEFIGQSSTDIAKVLWRLGYRKVTNGQYSDEDGDDD